MKKIWIDLTNTPHVNVLLPIIHHLSTSHELIISARDFSETIPLLKKNGIEPLIIGSYYGKSRLKKSFGLLTRLVELNSFIPTFDIGLSLGGNYTATLSRIRSKSSIVFSDNDISFKSPAYRFGNYFIFPSYFDTKTISKKYGIKTQQIKKFNGFKEDIYVADYKPDLNFLDNLPFDNFITIRPENLKASYIPKSSKTIVPQLFQKFRNENILFLPRYSEERIYAKGYKNIFIPDAPLRGLDVCYYTKAMLTGAGTFAREAALLGTPAISFFPGDAILSVDKIMQEKGWEYLSRDVEDMYKYVKEAKKVPDKIDSSKSVLKEVLNIIDGIISQI